MKPILKSLTRLWPFLVWCAVCLILFWPVRGYYMALPSPDSAPFFQAGHRLRLLEQMLAGATAISPHHLISLLLPPLVHNDLIYLIDTLLIAAGCAYWLRGRHLPSVAAWTGGGILAFAGYSFTLVSAGHMGFFHMTAYATFMFGFLVRAVGSGRWPYYALTGLFGAWIIMFAPDFGFLVLALAVVYGLWLILRNTEAATWRQRLKGLGRGVPIAALCFALGAFSTIRTIFTLHLSSRQQQVAGSVARPATPDSQDGESAPVDPHAQWIFATNWSLPPEEIVEFVAPCFLGTQSGDPRAPYWGRLGRTLGWEQHRQGFPNFRQHAIYLGGLQLMLAVFAVACCWRGRGRQSAAPAGSSAAVAAVAAGDSADRAVPAAPPASGARSAPWLGDVPFWACVWVVALLLAFGRHAPLYRLFYSLPYMSLLRAPVKFIRFVEVATAVLAASGVACLLQPGARRLRGWALGAGICAVIGVFASMWTAGADAAIRQALEPLGLAPATALLKANLARALRHGACAFAVAAAVFFIRGKSRGGNRAILALIVAWLALDALYVNRRFIQGVDLGPYYRKNLVTQTVLESMPHGAALSNHATPSTVRHWLSGSLHYSGIRRVEAIPEEDLRQMVDVANGDIVRLWEVGGAGFAMIPVTWSRSIHRDRCEHVAWLQIGDGVVHAVAQPTQNGAELVRVKNPLPYAFLSPTWRMVADDTAARAALIENVPAGRQEAVFTGSPLPDPPREGSTGTVTVLSSRFRDGALATRLEVSVDTPQALTVRESAQSPLVAYVGGERQTTASSPLGVGIYVPAGRHTIVLCADRVSPGMVAASIASILVLLIAVTFAWWGARGGALEERPATEAA